MPQTLEPGGLDEPRLQLAGRIVSTMEHELPSLVEEIVGDIRDNIPEYARPIDGPYGRTLRSGVERALRGFVDWVLTPNAPPDDIYRKLGEFEAYEGRRLDTLQSAYRVGAQTSWRRVMALHRQHALSPYSVSVLADALFAYLERLAAMSLEGYMEAKAQLNDELVAGRRRLLRLILDRAESELIAEQAAATGWTVPDEVTLVALRPGSPVVRTLLDDDLLLDLDGAEPHLLVPGPFGADRRAMLELALADSTAAAGLTVPLARAADSLRWSRLALGLIHDGVIGDGPLTLCGDHLVTLWLMSDAPLVDKIARRRLARLEELTPRQRERLTETLGAWLRTRGTAARVGDELGVHPQTVRYRMRQIEQILGDDLAEPDSRFAIEAVLRASWLRERAAVRDRAAVPEGGAVREGGADADPVPEIPRIR